MLLDSVNPDIVLAFFVILCSTFQSHFKARANAFEAVGAVVISIVMGYLLGWYLISQKQQPLVLSVAAASGLSYLGTAAQLAMQEFGKRLYARPLLILKWILPSAFEKLFGDEPTLPPTTNTTS